MTELQAAAAASGADATRGPDGSTRSQAFAASSGRSPLDRLVRAYERFRAEDLLFRDQLAGVRRRLEEGGADGSVRERWMAADRAYGERLDEPTARADAALARWRQALQKDTAGGTGGESAGRESLAAELHDALMDAASRLAPIEPSPRILRATTLPHRSLELAARRPVTSPAVIPSYLDPADPAPIPADLAGTAESPLSQAIVAHAAALGHDPVAIFEFVRNDVATEWYAGAMKGAEETLRQRAGNDVDQAALLVALLRASSQPARFVHGVVELPLSLAAESLNVAEGPQVLLALARAGVAHQPVVRGGRLAAVQVEATWVSARLPYGNYRGAVVDLSARTWVPLAPALEGFEGTASTAALRQMGFDSAAFARSYMSAPQASDPLSQLRQQVESWLAVHQPDATYAEQLGDRRVTPQRFGLAPSSLPVAVVAVVAEQTALDTARIQLLELVIREAVTGDSRPVLEHTLPLWEVANRRVTLSYLPATVDDHRTIDLFGGLDAVPPYLVRLRPQLRVRGRLTAVGEGTVDMASRQVVELRLVGPAGTVEVSQSLVAGGFQALAVGAQRFFPGGDDEGDPGDGESAAARLLSQLALAYGAAWDLADTDLGGLLAVSVVRPLPALVFAASEVGVVTVGELPVDLDWQGVTLDAALRVADPVARDAAHQPNAARDFLRLSSLQGSSLEQRVLEERFVVEAISADEGIARSRAGGIPVHEIDELNLDQVLPLLQHPPAVVAEIEAQARNGLRLEVPQRQVRHRDWLGSAWRAEDPATGASGYFLAGGLAGGATVVEPEDWPSQSFVWDLMAPYAAEPNTDPLAAAHIVKVGGTDGQVGEVGEVLPVQLAVLVFDDVGRPVQGAEVTFESSLGGGLLGDARPIVTVPTDRLGMASVPLRLGTDTSLEPMLLQLEPDDARFTRALRHVIEVAATTRDGVRPLAEPFTAVALPGPPVALERKNERSQPIRGTASLWSDTLLVGAVDEHGNEVSNVPLRFAVGAIEDIARCDPKVLPPTPLLNAAVFSAESCPTRQPRLGECGGPLLVLPSGPSGTAAGVILGNSSRNAYRVRVDAPETATLEGASLSYRYEDEADDCKANGIVVRATPLYIDESGANVNAAAASGTFAFEVHLFAYDGYPNPDQPVPCPGDGEGACVIGGGELIRARAERLYLRRGDVATGEWLTDEVPMAAGADHVYRGSMDVPAGENRYWVVGGHVTHLVDAVTGEARRVRDDKCVTEAFYCVTGRAPEVTGLTPRITGIAPQPVELDEAGTFHSPVEVSYITQPETYRGLGAAIELLDEGSPALRRSGSSRSGVGTATLPRGARGTNAQLLVNPSSPVEVRSPIVPLSLSSRLFPFFSPHVELRQDVDLANGRICRQPEVFRFTLARDARVELTLRQILDLGPGEEPTLGSGQTLLSRDLEAGEHSVPLLPEELIPGLYRVFLAGTDTQGVEEIEEGTAEVGLRASDALPLGHVLVQGVDLYDGSLVLSREDLAVPGRGVPLNLSRTYASGAGGALGPLGAGWTFSYDSRIVATPCGELILRGGEGSGIRFVSDGAGGFRPLRGYHGSLVPDPASFGFDFYAKGGNRYRFEPSRPNEWVLDFVADPNGNVTDLSYVAAPTGGRQLASVIDPAGRVLRFRWERREFVTATADVIVRVEGPAGLAVNFEYDPWGNLAGASREPHDDDGRPSRVERYAYATGPGHLFEQRHLLVSATDAVRGAVTRYAYSSGDIALPSGGVIVHRDFVEELTRPEGGIWRFAPDYVALAGSGDELVARVSDPRDHVTTYTLNRYGAPLAITDPLGAVTRTTWDLEHVVITSRTDANGGSTAYTYDHHGNLLTETVTVRDVDGETNALTVTQSYEPPEAFDPPFVKDRLATRTNRAGHTTRFAYDARGNLLTSEIDVEDADGAISQLTTTHSYYPNGDLRSTTDPRGNTSVFGYDAAGNLASVTDPRGGVIATAWDERSRPTRLTDAEGRTTILAHDTLGRETERALPAVPGEGDALERISRDDATGTQTETDAEGRATTSERDREGRLVRVVDATGAVKVFGYDASGNQTLESSWHDASTARNDTTFVYDAAGRLAQRDEPLGRRTTYEYDAAGNLTRETLGDAVDPSFVTRVTEHDYDGAGRRIRSRRVGDGFVTTEERKLDGEGRDVLLRDALGRETTQRFDALGRLIERTEPEWRAGKAKRTLFFYDGNGNLIRERRLNEPADQQREWQYDELDRPVLRRDATGAATILDYDRVGNLVREVDPLLDVVEHAYDARNRRTATTEHLDRISDLGRVIISYDHDRVGNLVAERLPNGNVRRHRYDARDRLIESSDGLGPLATFSYDARGNRIRELDANGNATVNTFDPLDRLLRQDLPANRRVLRTYDAAGNLVAETDPRGHTVRRTYDRLDRLVEVNDPPPHDGVRRFAYDLVGNKVTETDRRGFTTELAYDALDRLVTIVTPPIERDGNVRLNSTFTYDAVGNQVGETDRRGIRTEQTYDAENRVIETVRAAVRIESREYDAAGNLRFTTDANGNVTGYEYDERGLLVSENRPLAAITSFERDVMGDVVAETDPEGRETQRAYDLRRRLVEERNGAGERTLFEHDGVGNRTARIRPKAEGNVAIFRWEYDFDAANRLVAVRDPSGAETRHGYDGNGNRVSQRDALGRTTSFAFDELDRRIARIYPGGAEERYGYDAEGNLVSRVDPNGYTFATTYDGLGRVALESFPTPGGAGVDELASIAYRHDPNGNLLAVDETYTGPTGLRATRTSYDPFDRPEVVTDAFGKALRHGYDAAGNRTTLTDPEGLVTRYSFDALNRVALVELPSGGVVDYRYLRDSRLDAVLYPGGARADHTYDLAGRVQTIVNRSATELVSSYVYRYDANGNRLEQAETNGGAAEITSYDYDVADRLLEVAYPEATVRYTYDAVGNRRTEQRIASTGGAILADRVYSYDDRDRLLEIVDGAAPSESATYRYDPNGNQIARTQGSLETRYRFDTRDQIVGIDQDVESGGFRLLGRYLYDWQGLRVEKRWTASAEDPTVRHMRFTWDDQRLLSEHGIDGGTVARYDYGPNRLLRLSHSTRGASFYFADGLASPTSLLGDDGAVRERTQYDAWGLVRSRTGASENRFGFTGHELDAETDLYYAKARFFDTTFGRFLSEDPFAGMADTPPSLHRYLYAYSNPTVFHDPTGEFARLVNWMQSLSRTEQDVAKAAEEIGTVETAVYIVGLELARSAVATTNLVGSLAASTFLGETSVGREATAELDATVEQVRAKVKGAWQQIQEDPRGMTRTVFETPSRVAAAEINLINSAAAGDALAEAELIAQGIGVTAAVFAPELLASRAGQAGRAVRAAGGLPTPARLPRELSEESPQLSRLAGEASPAELVGPAIGRSGFRSTAELGHGLFVRYQEFVNDAYGAAVRAEAAGRLKIPPHIRREVYIGQLVDAAARDNLRAWLATEGLEEGPSALVRVNRRLYDPSPGSSAYRIPDLRTSAPDVPLFDATIGEKWRTTPQIEDFMSFSGNPRVTIVRPEQLGGSYSVWP